MTSSPLYAESLDDATASVRALRLVGLLSERQTDSLIAQVREFFDDALSAEAVLNHGDLWIGNAIWDGTRVVSIVDFEFAVIAPVELDLNELAKHAFGPADTIDDEQSVLLPRRQAVVDIATRLPGRASLLTGYAILLETWLTRREIDQRPVDDVRALDSCRRLVAVAEEDGGHLAPLLNCRPDVQGAPTINPEGRHDRAICASVTVCSLGRLSAILLYRLSSSSLSKVVTSVPYG